jgi:hypothetical protein
MAILAAYLETIKRADDGERLLSNVVPIRPVQAQHPIAISSKAK